MATETLYLRHTFTPEEKIKLGEDMAQAAATMKTKQDELKAAQSNYKAAIDVEAAKVNLALCEKLLKESGGAALNRDQKLQLLAALRDQKRVLEAAPLATLLDPADHLGRDFGCIVRQIESFHFA